MNEDEFENIRQKKLEELQIEKQKEFISKKIQFDYFTKTARERLNRIKLVNKELAERVEMIVYDLAVKNHIQRVDDNMLKNILSELTNQTKKEFRLIK